MADAIGMKISELAVTTDLAGLYTIGSDKNNQSKKVPLQFVKEAADYANAQGDYAKGVGDTVQGNTGVDEYPVFSASTQYAAGSVVRYNDRLYRFTALHPAGAWVGTDAVETSIKAEADLKLTKLSNIDISINGVAASSKMQLSEALPVSTEYESGVLLMVNGNKIERTTSNDYGVVWLKAERGESYHLYCSNTYRYPVYANAVFVEFKNSGVANEIISTVAAAGETELNVFYTPLIDGYIGMMVWDGAKYHAEKNGAFKDIATQNDITSKFEEWKGHKDIAIDKIGWARIGEIVYKGNLGDAYRMSDYVDISLASGLQATVEGNNTIDTISFFDKDKLYLPSLAIKSDGKKTYNIDLTADQYQNVAYITIGIMSNKPAELSARLFGELGELLKMSTKTQDLPIAIDKIGWARIGKNVYQGTLSDAYRMSDYVSIQGYGGLDAVVEGNSTIDTISFYDKGYNYLPNISIVTSGRRRYKILFNDDKYKDVAYVTIGISVNDISYIYASLIPIFEVRRSFAKKILCIGDSLTNSKPSSAPTGDYPHKWVEGVCAALNIPDFSLGGGAGANVANVGSNTIFSKVMALTTDEDVDIVTFWGGTNDWGASVEIGDISKETNPSTRDNTTFIGGLCACVEKILSLYPTKKILLIGTTPRTSNNNQDTYHNTTNSKGKYLKDYVDAVKEVAEWYGLPFLDLLRTSGMNLFNMEQYFYPQYTNDGSKYYLHFNQQGENLLAEKIAAFIRTIVVVNS